MIIPLLLQNTTAWVTGIYAFVYKEAHSLLQQAVKKGLAPLPPTTKSMLTPHRDRR